MVKKPAAAGCSKSSLIHSALKSEKSAGEIELISSKTKKTIKRNSVLKVKVVAK